MVFGNAGLLQLSGNAVFRAVALNPNFAVDDVEMNETAMNAAIVPSEAHDQVMIVGAIKDCLIMNVSVRVANVRILAHNVLDNPAICVQSIH